jgi:hypothetical protein
MGGGFSVVIGLNLHNNAARAVNQQGCTDQVRRDGMDAAIKEIFVDTAGGHESASGQLMVVS